MARFNTLFSNSGEKKEIVNMHPKIITKWIHYTKLQRNEHQYCDPQENEVINLADMIQIEGGVLQALLIRQILPDIFEILAGHKRVLACKYLVEVRGLEQYAFLPCVERSISDAKARFSVISTNTFHKKTDFEVMHEIEEAKFLLENYPEEFECSEETGRMVDRLSKRLNICRSVISDYQNIAHNLGEAGMKAFQKGNINKSAATQLAGLEESRQEEILEKGITKATDIKEIKKTLSEASKEDVPEQISGQLKIINTKMEIVQEASTKVSEFHVEFPLMKNMEQREQFLEKYGSWKVWTANDLTKDTYYRCDLPSGNAIVVKDYLYKSYYTKKEEHGAEWYYLKPTKYFHDCKSNLSELKEVLKDEFKIK